MTPASLSYDEIVAGLVGRGVPRPVAEKTARAELARASRNDDGNNSGIFHPAEHPQPAAPPAPAIVWPVRLTIPWSLLISDNDKHVPKSALLLTKEYRAAKARIHAIARDAVHDAAPAAQPLAITAHVWLPRRGATDIVNRAKIVHDALEHAVYENDRWLYDVHWLRAGVDVDAPRAELTILPIPPC